MSFRHFKSLLFKVAQIRQEMDKERARAGGSWVRMLKLKRLHWALTSRLERLVQESLTPALQPAPVPVRARRF